VCDRAFRPPRITPPHGERSRGRAAAGTPGIVSRVPGEHPLLRLLRAVDPLTVDDPSASGERAPDAPVRCTPGTGEPQWLQSEGWRTLVRPGRAGPSGGELLLRFVTKAGTPADVVVDRSAGVAHVPFSLAEAYEAYVRERWVGATAGRHLSEGTLDRFYRVKRLIPRRAQLAARRALVRWQGGPEFPAWPFDDSAARLLKLLVHAVLAASGARELRFRWFWPHGRHAAAILTHDVESAEGLRLALEIADLEEERGLHSSFNVVGDWYPIDHGVIDELTGRGFEIGVHGVFHDRSMFASRGNFEAQQPALAHAAATLGAVGFRSPATHRVVDWLAELPVEYDCTIPMSDPYEPHPGGCCSPWPFFLGDVVELPYTLPQDHTLFTLLRQRTPELWLAQLERLERAGGLVQCLSHPDPGYLADPGKRACYAEFLDALAARDTLWTPLPREVAAWWRARDAGEEGGTGVARLDDGQIVLEPSQPADVAA
jgi:peptidoglycan/xylan/chitin deacetylase (PgdA/CDA1 family)